MVFIAHKVKPVAAGVLVHLRKVGIMAAAVIGLAGIMTAAAAWHYRPSNRILTCLQREDYEQAVYLYNTRLSNWEQNKDRLTQAFVTSVETVAAGGEDYTETAETLWVLASAESETISKAAESRIAELSATQIRQELSNLNYAGAVAIYNSCRSENMTDESQDAMMQNCLEEIHASWADGDLSYEQAADSLKTLQGLNHDTLSQTAGEYKNEIDCSQLAALLEAGDYDGAFSMYRTMAEELRADDELTQAWLDAVDTIEANWRDGAISSDTARSHLRLISKLESINLQDEAARVLALIQTDIDGQNLYEQARASYEAGSYAEGMRHAAAVSEGCTVYGDAQELYETCRNAILSEVADPLTSEEYEACIDRIEEALAVQGDSELQNRLQELQEGLETVKAQEEEATRREQEQEQREREEQEQQSSHSFWNWFGSWF